MAINKRLTLAVVLLCATAMIMGCGSSSTTRPEDKTEAPILPPTNVRSSMLSGGDILITWDMSTQVHLAGYNVYRAESGSTDFTKRNDLLVQTNQFVDDAPQYKLFTYRVTSVSTRGTESGYTSVNIFNGYTGGADKDKDPKF